MLYQSPCGLEAVVSGAWISMLTANSTCVMHTAVSSVLTAVSLVLTGRASSRAEAAHSFKARHFYGTKFKTKKKTLKTSEKSKI